MKDNKQIVIEILKEVPLFGKPYGRVIELLVELVERNYLKHPILTRVYLGLSALILSILVGFLIIYTPVNRNQVSATGIKEQISELNQIESSINNLQEFIDLQKLKLTETEESIKKLNDEKQKLETAVNIDKTSVEALFRIQEERNRHSIWKERLIGFVIGIFSSIVASISIFVTQLFLKKRSVS